MCVWRRYGSRSLDLLKRYYQRELTDLSTDETADEAPAANGRTDSQHQASTSGRDSAENGGVFPPPSLEMTAS